MGGSPGEPPRVVGVDAGQATVAGVENWSRSATVCVLGGAGGATRHGFVSIAFISRNSLGSRSAIGWRSWSRSATWGLPVVGGVALGAGLADPLGDHSECCLGALDGPPRDPGVACQPLEGLSRHRALRQQVAQELLGAFPGGGLQVVVGRAA